MRAWRMTVELYKDEKLMPGHGAEAYERARKEPPPARRHIGFCPNPQSLRALMTARHDPPGKILDDLERATLNMQRGSNLWLCRGAARSGGSRLRRTRRLFMARGLSNGTIQWILSPVSSLLNIAIAIRDLYNSRGRRYNSRCYC